MLHHTLAGVVGSRFTADMMNVLKIDQQIPSWSEIINKPMTTPIPQNGAAICLVISKALTNVTGETFDAWMDYLSRLPREAQALFGMNIMSSKSPKRSIAATNAKFTSYAVAQGFLFT